MFKFKNPLDNAKGLGLTMAVTAFIAGASFCFAGSEWHNSPIFYYVNQLFIPWPVYGLILIAGGLCMFLEHFRPIGFLLAAILYTFFAITLWLGVIGGLHYHFFVLKYLHFPSASVGSFYAAGNATTLAVLYWSCVKQSVYAQANFDRNLSQHK